MPDFRIIESFEERYAIEHIKLHLAHIYKIHEKLEVK